MHIAFTGDNNAFLAVGKPVGQRAGLAGRRHSIVHDGGAGQHGQERQWDHTDRLQLLGHAG